MSMMAAMGLAQNLPAPNELENAATTLKLQGEEKVSAFLEMFAQVLRQQGISDQSSEPTEALKLYCSECGNEFAVTDAAGYYRRVEAGFLFACSNGHEPVILGSGRLGELVEVEAKAKESEHQLVVIGHAQDSDS